MIDQLKLIRRIWRIGVVSLAALALVFSGLFLSFKGVGANAQACSDSTYENGQSEDEYEEEECAESSPAPCENCGGNVTENINVNKNVNTNENKQEQTQENNQTVEITQNVTQNVTQTAGQAATPAAVPTQQPVTGSGVLGMALAFGAAPIGLLLSRYGRGRMLIRGREDDLGLLAHGVTNDRVAKKSRS